MAQPTRPDTPHQPDQFHHEPNPVFLIKLVAWLFAGPVIAAIIILGGFAPDTFSWPGVLGAAGVISLVAGAFVYRLKRPSQRVRPWSSDDEVEPRSS